MDKYKLLSELVIKSMANNKDNNKELNKILIENLCSEDFITRISSKEYFNQITSLLDEAYLLKDEEMLLKKINNYSKKQRMKRRLIALSSSAAAIILIIILFTFQNGNNVNNNTLNATKAIENSKEINFINPTLIIDNTDSIILNSKENKIVAQNYTNRLEEEKISKHRLIIPFKNTYTVILDDSTEVILNSNSELIFPSKFDANERKVIVKGEAFFNIKKDVKPFIVIAKNSYIKVYGTSFNINTRDENIVKTVLVNGSVAFGTEGAKEQFIKPNQMAIIDTRNNNHQIINVNANDYTAWKNGYFKFINSNFSDMITELNNWYGIVIKYDKEEFKNMKINLSISRTNSIEKMIKFLQDILKINIKEEGGEYRIYK